MSKSARVTMVMVRDEIWGAITAWFIVLKYALPPQRLHALLLYTGPAQGSSTKVVVPAGAGSVLCLNQALA